MLQLRLLRIVVQLQVTKSSSGVNEIIVEFYSTVSFSCPLSVEIQEAENNRQHLSILWNYFKYETKNAR